MRIVITGATGNVGTSVVAALLQRDDVDEIVGLARRVPASDLWPAERVTFESADVTTDRLEPRFEGADAVVHLAWLIQPSRDLRTSRATNVDGTKRVAEAALAAGVPRFVHASSVGAYAPGPKDRPVDESWPTTGILTSFYSRHKAQCERVLDALEERAGDAMRIVRLRKGIVLKREAATEIRRLFLGPLLPNALVRPELLPIIPALARLRIQIVHSLDAGDAYARAATAGAARGAYNIATEPVVDPQLLGELFGARPVRFPAAPVRLAALATWKLRLQPTPPGWLDMGLGVPIMDCSKAVRELGWRPSFHARETLREFIAGLRAGAGLATPPLDPSTSGPLRIHEVLTGIGGSSR